MFRDDIVPVQRSINSSRPTDTVLSGVLGAQRRDDFCSETDAAGEASLIVRRLAYTPGLGDPGPCGAQPGRPRQGNAFECGSDGERGNLGQQPAGSGCS